MMKQLVDSKFKFAQGGLYIKAATKVLEAIAGTFGAVTDGRIVDYCVRAAYMNRETQFRSLNSLLSVRYVKMLKNAERGMVFYEDTWLKEGGLSRDKLIHLIIDRSTHPLASLISTPAEETTKTRMHNMEVGYTLCQSATLGWTPTSPACQDCIFVDRCRANTRIKYPELFRLREEYGRTGEFAN